LSFSFNLNLDFGENCWEIESESDSVSFGDSIFDDDDSDINDHLAVDSSLSSESEEFIVSLKSQTLVE